MIKYKQYENGLRLILNKMEGMLSVSCGILVKTGSMNEEKAENGISHFIEHVMFKGTKTRSAFEISDHIDRIGAQINAFTSKELTCYYTKSTKEHTEKSLEILSDIFFDSVFDEGELEKEKGVIIEEINMSEDAPEEVCLDLLAESFYGKSGLGQNILGSVKNVKSFKKQDVYNYMDKYYTADNVVISVAGNIDETEVEKYVQDLFSARFKKLKSAPQKTATRCGKTSLYKTKRIEQSHIGFAMQGISVMDKTVDAFSIANIVLGGGMSSRLFQRIREELGLAYSVYSYASQYKDDGVLEIYAGVNTALPRRNRRRRRGARRPLRNAFRRVANRSVEKSRVFYSRFFVDAEFKTTNLGGIIFFMNKNKAILFAAAKMMMPMRDVKILASATLCCV